MDQENQKKEPEKAPEAEKTPKAEKAPKEKAATGAKEKAQKTRTPTAKKRMLQSEKHQLINRSLKSQVKSAIRTLKESFTANKDLKQAQAQLNAIYSLVDKGQKKNIFKKNKAGRVKSTLSKLLQKTN